MAEAEELARELRCVVAAFGAQREWIDEQGDAHRDVRRDAESRVDDAPESILGHAESIGRRAIASKCARDFAHLLKCFAKLPKTRVASRTGGGLSALTPRPSR
jgi:hypothetical protein